jgi:hypothetical protein
MFTWLHLLQLSLDVVKGQGASGGKEAGNEGATHDRGCGALLKAHGLNGLLGLRNSSSNKRKQMSLMKWGTQRYTFQI